MPDFSISLPDEICAELGQRARIRRLALNLPITELAQRIGIAEKTLRTFEQTGRCTLETFARILEAFNALPDLQTVLVTPSRSIEEMRRNEQGRQRQRAYRKPPPTAGRSA
jgi:transcriptional regulator with XRE-family HTH domain